MMRFIIITLFLFLPQILMSQDRDRTPTLNLNLELNQILGEFGNQIEDPFLGIDINTTFPLGRRVPIGLGFNFGWGVYNRYSGNLTINGFIQSAKFTDHIYTYSPFLRLKPINSRFNPYIDGGIGLRRFLTRYSVDSGNMIIRERYGDQQFGYVISWAFGLEIFINRSIFLEMRFEQNRGSEITNSLGDQFQTNTRGFGLGIGFRL